MKFFHLSDLHIGKQLHRYNLKEDQQVILKEVITYAKELRPDATKISRSYTIRPRNIMVGAYILF